MSKKDIHEVEEPRGGDERAFKAKHKVKITDYPEGTKVPSITTGKKKRLADPDNTEVTYEEVEHIDEALNPAHKTAITKHVKKMWGKGTVSFSKQDGNHFVTHSDGIQQQVHSIHMKKGVPHVTHFMSMDEQVEQIDELDRNQGGILDRYTGKTRDNPDRKKSRDLALMKRWGDKKYGLPEPKVKAVQREETESLDELDQGSYGILGRYSAKAAKKVETGEEELEKRAKGRMLAGMKRRGGVGGIPAAKVPAVQREEAESLDELTGYRNKPLFGKDVLSAVANRAMDRIKLPPNGPKKLSPEELASNKKNNTVAKRALERMEEEVETEYSLYWRDTNGMDKQKHGLSEEEATRLASSLEASGSVNVFIDEEQMTDAQKKKREEYVKGMKSEGDDLRKRYGKRWKDVMYAIATKNAMKEEAESLDEISKTEDEPLHTQLRKRTNANEVSLTFKDGKTHVVSRGHANKAISMLSNLRPSDRQHAHAEMSKSHEHFMDALDGKISKPGKASISLAGPKLKNEDYDSNEAEKARRTKEFFNNPSKIVKRNARELNKKYNDQAVTGMKNEEVEELDETHRVGVTYSDPNNSSVAMRGEKTFKQVKVKADSEDEAISKAKKHFKNNGYKVHDATITTVKEEIEELDEAGNVIPPKTQKMKSSSDGGNNFKLDTPRAKSYNVPTQKDRALEMDEEIGILASKLIEKVKVAEEEKRLQDQKLLEGNDGVVEVEVVDVFKGGEFKLRDESVVVISEEQASAMNELFHSLSVENKATLLENTISDKQSFIKVISFALGENE